MHAGTQHVIDKHRAPHPGLIGTIFSTKNMLVKSVDCTRILPNKAQRGKVKNIFPASPQLPRKKQKIVTVRNVIGLQKTYGKNSNKPCQFRNINPNSICSVTVYKPYIFHQDRKLTASPSATCWKNEQKSQCRGGTKEEPTVGQFMMGGMPQIRASKFRQKVLQDCEQ